MTFTTNDLYLMDDVVRGLMDYDDLPENLQDNLMEHFMPQMPYGTAKATTGDPIEFIIQHLPELIQEVAIASLFVGAAQREGIVFKKKYEIKYMKCLGYDLMTYDPNKSSECQRCVRLSPRPLCLNTADKFIDPQSKLGSPCKKFIRR